MDNKKEEIIENIYAEKNQDDSMDSGGFSQEKATVDSATGFIVFVIVLAFLVSFVGIFWSFKLFA